MAVNDIYEVRLEGVCNSGERWNHVLHYRVTDEAGQDAFTITEDLALAVSDDYEAKIMTLLAADHFFTGTRCVKVFPELGVPVVHTEATAVAGSIAGEALPADVAVVCTKRTAQAGRIGIGRMFVSGLPETHAALDTLILAERPNWSDGVGDFFLLDQQGANAEVYELGVFSRKLAGNDPPPPEVWFKVNRAEVDITLRNQRPRGRTNRNPFAAVATQ